MSPWFQRVLPFGLGFFLVANANLWEAGGGTLRATDVLALFLAGCPHWRPEVDNLSALRPQVEEFAMEPRIVFVERRPPAATLIDAFVHTWGVDPLGERLDEVLDRPALREAVLHGIEDGLAESGRFVLTDDPDSPALVVLPATMVLLSLP